MAGEWLKIEISTPDKPEVLRMSRILNIDRDAVFGKLLRLWAWFDKNSVDGVVDGVVDADIDNICKQDGFAAACQSVGWLLIDKGSERISIPNFDRHNGESAKKRALKNERQARWRKNKDDDASTNVDTHASTDASTREEKRRINTKEAADAADTTIWDLGIKFLKTKGVPEKQARTILGSHYKADKEKLASVVAQMLTIKPIEPIAYLQKAMQPEVRRVAI